MPRRTTRVQKVIAPLDKEHGHEVLRRRLMLSGWRDGEAETIVLGAERLRIT